MPRLLSMSRGIEKDQWRVRDKQRRILYKKTTWIAEWTPTLLEPASCEKELWPTWLLNPFANRTSGIFPVNPSPHSLHSVLYNFYKTFYSFFIWALVLKIFWRNKSEWRQLWLRSETENIQYTIFVHCLQLFVICPQPWMRPNVKDQIPDTERVVCLWRLMSIWMALMVWYALVLSSLWSF